VMHKQINEFTEDGCDDLDGVSACASACACASASAYASASALALP